MILHKKYCNICYYDNHKKVKATRHIPIDISKKGKCTMMCPSECIEIHDKQEMVRVGLCNKHHKTFKTQMSNYMEVIGLGKL